jgi:hypothetical protein
VILPSGERDFTIYEVANHESPDVVVLGSLKPCLADAATADDLFEAQEYENMEEAIAAYRVDKVCRTRWDGDFESLVKDTRLLRV